MAGTGRAAATDEPTPAINFTHPMVMTHASKPLKEHRNVKDNHTPKIKALASKLLRQRLKENKLKNELGQLKDQKSGLMHALYEIRGSIKEKQDEVREHDTNLTSTVEELDQLEMEFEVSTGIVDKSLQPYADMNDEEVQTASGLDTEDDWEILTTKGTEGKARLLQNFGWASSRYCHNPKFRLVRADDENKIDHKNQLKNCVGFKKKHLPVAVAQVYPPVKDTVASGVEDSVVQRQITEMRKKLGKRGYAEYLKQQLALINESDDEDNEGFNEPSSKKFKTDKSA